MRNQFFGNIHDYQKYGVLRALSADGSIRTGICWMLTDAGAQGGGMMHDYLQSPDKWRSYDPALFDALARCLSTPNGGVKCAETEGILPGATYFTEPLADEPSSRQQFFSRFRSFATDSDLVFFDPDRGMEIESVRYGKTNSSRYLYWKEAADTFAGGRSVLVYQHFPREPRDAFTARVAATARERTGASNLLSFHGSHAMLLLLSQPRHEAHFRQQSMRVEGIWGDQIRVTNHQRPALDRK